MYTKKQLLDLMEKLYADKDLILVGEELSSYPSVVTTSLETFKKANGKYPGILGFDVRQANLTKLGKEGRERVVNDLIEYARKGGVITFSAHMANPRNQNPDESGWMGVLGGDDAWMEMLTEGTELNKWFKVELTTIADFLTIFRDENIPIIWRPFHEMNIPAFWFCIARREGEDRHVVNIKSETFVAAWKYMYDYFTIERKLDNLLWEYTPNMVRDDETRALYGYVGDMCDLVGMDYYVRGEYEIGKNSTYKDLASTGKPVALSEWGPAGIFSAKPEEGQKQGDIYNALDLRALLNRMKEDGYYISYLLTWCGKWTLTAITKGDEFMRSKGILGLEDVAQMW